MQTLSTDSTPFTCKDGRMPFFFFFTFVSFVEHYSFHFGTEFFDMDLVSFESTILPFTLSYGGGGTVYPRAHWLKEP